MHLFPSGWSARLASRCPARTDALQVSCRGRGNRLAFLEHCPKGSRCASSPNSLCGSTRRRHFLGSHNDISQKPHFRVSTRGLSLVCFGRHGIFRCCIIGVALMHADTAETDVRTLSVRLDPRGERPCVFSDAVHMMEEHALHHFPIQGPRTTHQLLLKIVRSELGPMARHHWWRQAMELSSSDPGVDEHLFSCELLGHGTQYDQLNLPDLALLLSIITMASSVGGTPCRKVARVRGWRCFGWACHGTIPLLARSSTKRKRSGGPRIGKWLLHSLPRRQSPSRTEAKDVKNVKWRQLPLTLEAGTIESLSSEATWWPSPVLCTASTSRPAVPSPDLLPLPTGVGFLLGFEHVKEKVWLRSAVDAINELGGGGRGSSLRTCQCCFGVLLAATLPCVHVLGQEPGHVDDMAVGKPSLFKRGLVSLPRVQAG